MIRAFMISFLLGLAVISIADDIMSRNQVEKCEQVIKHIHEIGRCAVQSTPNKISGNPSRPLFEE